MIQKWTIILFYTVYTKCNNEDEIFPKLIIWQFMISLLKRFNYNYWYINKFEYWYIFSDYYYYSFNFVDILRYKQIGIIIFENNFILFLNLFNNWNWKFRIVIYIWFISLKWFILVCRNSVGSSILTCHKSEVQ